jgi:hypothetical protein
MYHFFVGLALVVLFPINLVLSRSEFPISSYLVFDVLRNFVKKKWKRPGGTNAWASSPLPADFVCPVLVPDHAGSLANSTGP